jgi:DNA-binding CsgD family transcriptional regulator
VPIWTRQTGAVTCSNTVRGAQLLDESVSTLIGDIYGGTQDQALWNRTMERISSRLHGRFLMVATVDFRNSGPPSASWYGNDSTSFARATEEYEADTFRIDPTIPFAAAHPRGGRFDSLSLAAHTDYLKEPYVRWNRDKLKTTFWQALLCRPTEDLCFGISLHRTEADGPLGDRDDRLLRMLFAHMKEATRLASRSPDLASPEPLLLLDARGRLMEANDSARRLLAARDGVVLVDRLLRATDRRHAGRLDAAIRSALASRTEGSVGGAVELPRENRSPLILIVNPLPPEQAPFDMLRAAALVRIIDRDAAPPLRPRLWKEAFGFTPAETRLAEALVTGEGTLRNTAEDLGMAYETARVHLANIFGKAGVRSQSQLVRLLTRLG